MRKITKRIFAFALAIMLVAVGSMSAFALTACSDCGRIFEDNSAYSVHAKVCKPAGDKKITYVCSYCEAVFEQQALLSAHISGCPLKPSFSQKGNQNACPRCLEVFNYEHEYNNHIQLCREVFPCSKCGKEYTTKAFRNAHYIVCDFMNDVVDIDISIVNNPGSKAIKFGDVLKVSAEAKNLPAGVTIKWIADGNSVSLEPSADGKNCSIKAVADGKSTVFVRLVTSDGTPVRDAYGTEIYDSEVVDVDGGFFQKIISFFKDLFRIDRTVTQ